MSQELYQKYHGLPGIGVSGKTGNKGKKGPGVYIGFVNDFFNTNSVDVDTVVRVARQIASPGKKGSGFTGSFKAINNNTAIIDTHFLDASNNFLEFTCLSDVYLNSISGRKNYYDLYQMGYGDDPQDKSKWNYNEEVEQYISPTRVVVDMRHLTYQYDTDDYDDTAIVNNDGSAKGVTVLYTADNQPKYFSNSKAYLTADQIVPSSKPKETPFDSSYIRTAIEKKINNEKNEDGLFYNKKSYYITPSTSDNIEIYNEYVQKYSEIFDAFYNDDVRKYNNLATSLTPNSDADYDDLEKRNQLNYVLWEEKNSEAVAIPTTLKEEFVEGDILYVYTNKNRFEHNGYKIDYMINVTKDMIGANYSYVISHAIAKNPFAFAEFTKSGDKVVLNNDINFIRYDISTNDLLKRMKSQFVENYNEQLEFNDYIVEISKFGENEKECNFISLSNASDTTTLDSSIAAVSFDSSFIVDASLKTNNKGVKFSSLYINDETKTPELYTRNLLLPPFINFTNEAFLPALQEAAYNDSNATFKINKSDYINNSANSLELNYNYGAIIADNHTGECKEIINPTNGTIYLDVSFYGSARQKYVEDASYDFSIIPFVDVDGCMRYMARQTDVKIFVDSSGNVSRTIDSMPEKYNTDIIWQETNDIEFTLIGNIGVEETENASVKININNTNVNINSIRVYINGKDDITPETETQNYEWVEISYDKQNYIVNLQNIKSNLPNINGRNVSTLDDYFMDSSFIELDVVGASNIFDMIKDKTLISTLERKLLLTVTYKLDGETDADELHRAFYWITQPGFSDPRVLPSVEFTNQIEQIELENTNANDNGVLCNQFQYFIDISINGFNSDEWAKYAKDIRVDLDLESMNESFNTMASYAYSAAKQYANIKQVYEQEGDLGDNINSFLTSFYIQTYEVNGEKNTIKELEDNALLYKADDSSDFYWNVDSSYYLNIVDEEHALNTENVYGLEYVKMTNDMYVPEESACKFNIGIINKVKFKLRNIPIEYLQNKDKHLKIRVLFEQSNPVITRIEYNFVVTNLVIHYKEQDFIFTDNPNYELSQKKDGFLYTFHDDQLTGFMIPNFMSGEQEFYFRPVSFIAAPAEAESSTGLRYSAVKISGSEDNILVGLKMYSQNYLTSLAENPISSTERNRLFKSAIEWNKAILKKRYLQDDISNIQILSNEPYSIFEKLPKNNSFIKILNSFDDNFTNTVKINTQIEESDDFQTNYENKLVSTIINANEEEFPIFRNFGKLENIYNIFGTNAPYLCVTYRNDWLHPKLRDDKNTFYYNDKLYEAERYSQFEINSPAFVCTDTSVEVRSQELLNSIDVWNFEYQYSGYASYNDTYLGKVSVYSTGYEYLNDGADTGQYDEKDALSLANTRAMNEELVLDKISTHVITLSKFTERYPKSNNAFRTILYALRWQYPVFTDANTYYGFDVVSPLMSTLDNAYLNTAYKCNFEIFDTNINLYKEDSSVLKNINSSFRTNYGDDASIYLELKMEDSRKDSEKKEFHNMIPYNILYNVYPRIAYNDEKKSITVLTLRRPSISNQNSTKLDKHYFEMTSYPECEQPYTL